MLLTMMACRGAAHENQREEAEHQRLNQADKELEAKKGDIGNW